MITFCGVHHSPSILLLLDAEKAFDRIHWGYLNKVLGNYVFCGGIKDAISSLYFNLVAHFFAEGLFSEQFSITNGTRQGCPLSHLIFALLMERLAEKIGITGIAPRGE